MLDGNEISDRYNTEIKKHETEIKTLMTQRDYILKKIEVLNRFKKQVVHSEDDVKKLMKVLCWENLSYCCRPRDSNGRGKNCMWRDGVLSLLGISNEEFMAVKEKAVEGLLPPISNKK